MQQRNREELPTFWISICVSMSRVAVLAEPLDTDCHRAAAKVAAPSHDRDESDEALRAWDGPGGREVGGTERQLVRASAEAEVAREWLGGG